MEKQTVKLTLLQVSVPHKALSSGLTGFSLLIFNKEGFLPQENLLLAAVPCAHTGCDSNVNDGGEKPVLSLYLNAF